MLPPLQHPPLPPSPVCCSPKRARTSSSSACRAANLQRPPSTLAPALQQNTLLFQAVEALFAFKPFFALASSAARKKILQRGRDIGLDFEAEVASLQGVDWEARRGAVEDRSLRYPAYYTQPFHAYEQGNLCWDAALQASVAAQSVHAPVMDPEGKVMAPDGDRQLRRSYTAKLLKLMRDAEARAPGNIVDLGCSTGLSTVELARSFPDAATVTGLDLSPFFLAMATYQQEQGAFSLPCQEGGTLRSQGGRRQQPSITFRHAAAEESGLPEESVDFVSCCLVMHELPAEASRAVIEEGFRLLRPGGTFAVMEMDPQSVAFQRIFQNPFAYAAFKSTEPWLTSYVGLDLPEAFREAGFRTVLKESSSPRHFTLVAVK